MKARVVRDMSTAELEKKLDEIQRELWGLRVKVTTQQNTSRIRELRRDAARVKTALTAHYGQR